MHHLQEVREVGFRSLWSSSAYTQWYFQDFEYSTVGYWISSDKTKDQFHMEKFFFHMEKLVWYSNSWIRPH